MPSLLRFAGALALFGSLAPAQETYRYDKTGRLIAVEYGDGAVLRYAYDNAGNLLSQAAELSPSSPPVISEFTPRRAAPGSQVRIRGRNLRTALSEEFNGVPGALVSISDSELIAVVPGQASSGPISVRTAFGLAVSKDRFVVARDGSTRQLELEPGRTAEMAVGNGTGLTRVDLESGGAPHALMLYRILGDNGGVAEIFLPPSPPARFQRLFATAHSLVAIANLGDAPARVELALRNGSGTLAAEALLHLGAGESLSRRLRDWFPLAPELDSPASLDVAADHPLSVAAIETWKTPDGAVRLAHLPAGAPQSPPAGEAAIFPEAEEGALRLLNLGAAASHGIVRVYDRLGNSKAETPFHLSSHGAALVPVVGGAWLRISTLDGSPVPAATFLGGVSHPPAVVTTRARIFHLPAGPESGLSIANPHDVPLLARERKPHGRRVEASIPPRGQTTLPPVHTLEASVAFALAGYRSGLSVVPAADATRPAHVPLLFPHPLLEGQVERRLVLVNIGSVPAVLALESR